MDGMQDEEWNRKQQ